MDQNSNTNFYLGVILKSDFLKILDFFRKFQKIEKSKTWLQETIKTEQKIDKNDHILGNTRNSPISLGNFYENALKSGKIENFVKFGQKHAFLTLFRDPFFDFLKMFEKWKNQKKS
jgi:fatty acid/phospholipid biosynthesis enzyme